MTEEAIAAVRALLAAVSPLGWAPGPLRGEDFYPWRIGAVDGYELFWDYRSGPYDHQTQRWLPATADLLARDGAGRWAKLQSVSGPDVRRALVLIDGKPASLEVTHD